MYQQNDSITNQRTDMTRREKKELAIVNRIKELENFCNQIAEKVHTLTDKEEISNLYDVWGSARDIIINLQVYKQEATPIKILDENERVIGYILENGDEFFYLNDF